MKVFAISDFHLCLSGAKPMEIFGDGWSNYLENIKTDWVNKVSNEDVVLIAGDISWAMKPEEAKDDLKYFEQLPGKKIFIRGNHDYWWQSISSVRSIMPNDCFAIQNDAIKIGEYIFCGTRGWTCEEKKSLSAQDEKIYKREVLRLEMALDCAKKLNTNNEKIVCLIHYPPFNSLRQPNELTNLMTKYNVSKCVYGHLHGSCGRQDFVVNINNVEYYLTSCDLVNNKLCQIF